MLGGPPLPALAAHGQVSFLSFPPETDVISVTQILPASGDRSTLHVL